MSEKEKLLSTLFDDPTRKHMDIKFLRGTSLPSGIEGEELMCAQANDAILRLQKGELTAEDRFPETFQRFDVRAKTFV